MDGLFVGIILLNAGKTKAFKRLAGLPSETKTPRYFNATRLGRTSDNPLPGLSNWAPEMMLFVQAGSLIRKAALPQWLAINLVNVLLVHSVFGSNCHPLGVSSDAWAMKTP